MALRELAKFQVLRNLLGFDRDPLEDVKSIQSIRSSRAMDLNRAKTQALNERKFAYDQAKDTEARQHRDYKLLFTQMTSFYNSTPEGDPKRELYTQSMEKLFYGMSKPMQAAFIGTSMLRPISPEERRGTEFRRSNPRPRQPTDENGQPLAWTEENEPRIMQHRIEDVEWSRYHDIVKYGAAEGKAGRPVPSMMQGKDWAVGEGGNVIEGSGKIYLRDSATKQIATTSWRMLGIDQKKAQEWGWPTHKMLTKDFAPTAPAVTGVFGGTKVAITPGIQLSTGAVAHDEQAYGTPDDAIKGLPKAWKQALGFKARGVKFDNKEVKDQEVVKVLSILEEFEGKHSKAELARMPGVIDTKFRQMYPEVDYTFTYSPDALKKPWIFGRNKFIIPGTAWVASPRMRVINVTDGAGQSGQLNVDNEGKAHDKNKNAIEEVTGPIEEGDAVPSITFKISEHFRKRNVATTEGLFEIERRARALHARFSKWAEKTGGTMREFMTELDEKADASGRWLIEGMGPEKAAQYVESIGE